jgi:hypothetical protein
MRACFICRSESPGCGHREPEVTIALYDAKRRRVQALSEALVMLAYIPRQSTGQMALWPENDEGTVQ